MTVSRVLNHPEKVSPDLTQRVRHAIEALGYQPNPTARALALARSATVGVLLPSLSNQIYAQVIEGIHAEAEGSGLAIQLGNTRYDPRHERALLEVFLRQRPSGLIVTGIDQPAATRQLLMRFDCPVVQIMDRPDRAVANGVGFSHEKAAELAVHHLLAAGYCRPAFLGRARDARSRQRAKTFCKRLEARLGVAVPCIDTDRPSTAIEGARLLAALLEQHPNVDAVFCNNDNLALGALFEAQRRHLAVPESLGILGFNDLEFAAATHPPLSTIATPREAIGRLAMRCVLSGQQHPGAAPEQLELTCVLQVRGSTRATPDIEP
jgi:LacI family gluconate utilization system Gnt-I transcriptional repressor